MYSERDCPDGLSAPLILIWDNLNARVSGTMHELIAARSWLTVCQLPPYAHELNPGERVWSHLKRSLANLAKHNLGQLAGLLTTRLNGCSTGPALSRASSPAPGSTSHPFVTPTIKDV
jgi:putative transposase